MTEAPFVAQEADEPLLALHARVVAAVPLAREHTTGIATGVSWQWISIPRGGSDAYNALLNQTLALFGGS